MHKYRLAIIAPHPIQYQAPLFKKIAQDTKIGLEEYQNPGFGKRFKWDISLFDGDVDKLVFFLQKLCQDKEKRLICGEKSFEIAGNYSYEQDLTGILEALESVA